MEYCAFPEDISLTFDLMSGDRTDSAFPDCRRVEGPTSAPSPSRPRRSRLLTRSGRPNLLKARTQEATEERKKAASPVSRPRPHLRPEAERLCMEARRHSVRRWSTLELSISSNALGPGKGEDSAARQKELAHPEAKKPRGTARKSRSGR